MGSLNIKSLHVVENAHRDDIHTMLHLAANQVITGSKDGCLRLWSANGCFLKDMRQKHAVDYCKWTTAICKTPQGKWVAGSRDGVLTWNKANGEATKFHVSSALPSYCKTRNMRRIACLEASPECSDEIYCGMPTTISKVNIADNKLLSSTRVSSNDWVYMIDRLRANQLMVTIGCELAVWTESDNTFHKNHIIVKEQKRRGPRPFS